MYTSGASGGNNNGFDHVYQTQDGMVYVLESKQVGSSGGLRLSQTVDGSVQMSNDWIGNVLGELEANSAAYKAVVTAKANNTLVRGVLAVDKATGKLTMVKLN